MGARVVRELVSSYFGDSREALELGWDFFKSEHYLGHCQGESRETLEMVWDFTKSKHYLGHYPGESK